MLILSSLGPSGFRDVSGDSIGLPWTLLASTTSPLRCSHAQACGGVAAVAAPQAAGAPFWVGLRTVVAAAAPAALAPDEISSHPENAVSAAAAVVLPGLEEALL
jgi:hypothetical protein